jgi:hypothetical protein
MTQTQNQVYAYTQHVQTIRVIEEACSQKITILIQDRTRDSVEDVLRQLPQEAVQQGATLYVVMPVDRLVELKQRAPRLRIKLLQLDGTTVERMTGRSYDPKVEYPKEVVLAALRTIEVKGGRIRYMSFGELAYELKRHGKVAVFNDVMREGVRLVLERFGVSGVELVKTCDDGGCVEINPMGSRSGYRISFPGTTGRLTSEQIADALISGVARVYHVEIEAEEVPLCS